MLDTRSIIEKWYQRLDFPESYDREFYEAIQNMEISDAITIDQYDIDTTDGKRNLLSALYMCEELAKKSWITR